MEYQISKVYLAFMYKENMHMVYGELHILSYLALDQNANYNSYSAPLRQVVWNVDQKRVILGIDLYYNTFSHLWVPPHHYPEHDTFFLSVFFPWIFFLIFLDQWHHFGGVPLPDNFWIPELNLHLFFSASVHFNMWIKSEWPRNLNPGNQLIYK